ncbi:MAG TPA: DUF2336 domain-containing protein, partial [Aestuariivirgaceae bacterium]|nr:DUF2336 domain-containing protein [Aestuariivirgaceae bacterium]
EPPAEPPHHANGHVAVAPLVEPPSFVPHVEPVAELAIVDESPVISEEIYEPPQERYVPAEPSAAIDEVVETTTTETSDDVASTEALLAIIRNSIVDAPAPAVAHHEPERSESIDDMLAAIRAAIFADADPAVADGNADAGPAAVEAAPDDASTSESEPTTEAVASAVEPPSTIETEAEAEHVETQEQAESSLARPLLKVEFVPTPGRTQSALRFVIEPSSSPEAAPEIDATIDHDAEVQAVDARDDVALESAVHHDEPFVELEPGLVDAAASLPLIDLDLAAPDEVAEVEIAASEPSLGLDDEETETADHDATPIEAQTAPPDPVLEDPVADDLVSDDLVSDDPVVHDPVADDPVAVEEREIAALAPSADDVVLEEPVTPGPALDELPPEVVEPAVGPDADADQAEAEVATFAAPATLELETETADIASAAAEIEAATDGILLAPAEQADEPVLESDPQPMEDLQASATADMAEIENEPAPFVESAPEAVESAETAETDQADEPSAVEIITPGNRTRSTTSILREVRSHTRDYVAAAQDEFAATYDTFAAPRVEAEAPPEPEAEDAANLARPAEYKFWEQEPSDDADVEEKVDAAAVYAVIPEIARDLPAARAALAGPELPSDQAGQIAQSLLDIMSLTSHSVQPQERALASDTLLHLLHRLPLKILVTISERLSVTDQPPSRIITRLIRDSRIEVAGPLLEKCNSIGDQDLIGVIGESHIQSIRVIARRRTLSSGLCDALIATREPSTVLTLVRNPGAELSHPAFFRLNELARAYASLQAPLATRSDLPAPVAFELFWVLPAELRRYVLSRFLADSLTLERILRITKSVGGESEPETMAMRFPPRHKIEQFVDSLTRADADPAAELAELAGIDPGTAGRIIADKHGDPLAIAFKALGLQRARFAEVLEILRSSPGKVHLECGSEELQNLFDSLSFNKARVLLTYWDWAVSGTGPYAELAR